jgi:hypothetical protein
MSQIDINAPGTTHESQQLLHLVFGGQLTHVDEVSFQDLDKLDVVGIFPDYETARKAWQAAAQRTVDSAMTRYFIVHLHKLMQP